MKTGYPFLKIAQKHNVDYGLVLKAADYSKNPQPSFDFNMAYRLLPIEVIKDIRIAVDEYRELQAGTRKFSEQHDVAA